MDKDELTNKFKSLGVTDPEGWAESEINEGIPQLARCAWLKGAWQIVPDRDVTWVDNVLKNYKSNSKEPFYGRDHAIKTMIEYGVTKECILDLVKAVSGEMIFHIGYMLDDPGVVIGNSGVNWALVELDSNDEVKGIIPGLHESVLETDPEDREVAPYGPNYKKG